MFKEFKEFVLRGNVLDLAIGIVIGTAFGAIVASLVNDVIMPPIGLLLGKVNFANLFIDLSGKGYATLALAKEASAPTINYGSFLNTLINFLLIALVIFFLVKGINKLRKPEVKPDVAPITKDCPYCFTTISIKATRCPNCTSELK
jgi:large conductance mechanosensitive channel